MNTKPIYDPRTIEPKWQKYWAENKVYQPDLKAAKKPFYNLMMFPYPSAEGLHVGNMYAFAGADVYGRFQRMQGKDVFEPIGLDGFGIHSENYAIKVGKHPAEHAKDSEKHFYQQLHMIGNGFAWDQKLETYDPDYYRWTQWLFVQMYKHGLAYRKKAMVNWCPSCKTVLSDEQVEGGVCERCKTPTTRKETEQWFFRITKYANRLLENLQKINWPKKIVIAQRNWIGKKGGINIIYRLKGLVETITCFTTTPVNFGATFLVVSPDHPIVEKIVSGLITTPERKKVQVYIEAVRRKTEQQRKIEERQKTGVFSGLMAINHLTNKEIPVWISDFVLMTVGTGAVQGCPGHDKRDFEFAKKFRLPIQRVVVGLDGDKTEIIRLEQVIESAFPGKMINSDFLNGMEFAEAMRKTMDYFEEKGWGKRVITYHLRDWLISRQRYWGPPIPMIFCEKCNWQPVPEGQLPVLLPEIKDFQPKGDGKSPLQRAPKEWLETVCPNCGGKAKRETDVSDTFLDSSWYFLAYPNLNTAEWNRKRLNDSNHLTLSPSPFNQELTKKWLPVNVYIGGAEHAVLHLLYSRFVWMALSDWGYLPKGEKEEGKRKKEERNDTGWEEPFPFLFSHGLIIKDGAKMSKSRGNVVNPDEYIGRFGADALRMYLMFLGPYNQGGDFRDTGMAGMYRFLERIWNSFQKQQTTNNKQQTTTELKRLLHRTIQRVTKDIANFKYNTAIAGLMEFMNVWEGKNREQRTENTRLPARQGEQRKSGGSLSKEDAESLIKLFSPFTPHLAEELWARMGNEPSVHLAKWPGFDEKLAAAETARIPVQVNGKTRAVIEIGVERAGNQGLVEEIARGNSAVKRHLASKMEKQVIFVSGKILNFVVE